MSTTTQEAQFTGAGPRFVIPLPLLFGVTILCSACLLFLVQPLASKLILPWFGGSAAVWITCLLFFQVGLLCGYLYAHGLNRKLSPRGQAVLHTLLLVLSLATLPILPGPRWQPRPGQDPTWLVLGALATSIGLPYLLLSSTGPLLQSWYARASHGALPYRYFALSNAGSLAALLAYPVLIEPRLSGHRQAWMWSIAFACVAGLCIATAWSMRSPEATQEFQPRSFVENAPVAVPVVLLWLGLAACGTTLLMTVTSLMTQNIAPMPLLWVIPLSVYLLTFILAFEGDRWYNRYIFLPLLLPALACLGTGIGLLHDRAILLQVPLLAVALFVACMACHGELARLRPSPSQLTAFYLCLSAGGALGGLFVGLFAPHIFPAMYEYPIAFVAPAVLLLVALWRERRSATSRAPSGGSGWMRPSFALGLWLAAFAGTLALAAYVARATWRDVHYAKVAVRNFYGALQVNDVDEYRASIRELSHGTITHGIQFLDPKRSRELTTYYARESGIGLAWQALQPSGPLKLGVVGLGAGTLAAYGREGDTMRFYEINPSIVQIARSQFTFLSDSPSRVEVVLGDARLSLAQEPSQQFDLLVVDAFSGDAIPVHLLTREAFQIYWRHLKPDGVLAIHISNEYLNLAPVVLSAAKESGKEAWQIDNDDDNEREVYSASYVLVTNRPAFFADPLFKSRLTAIDVPRNLRTWTDDYSNLWQVLSFH